MSPFIIHNDANDVAVLTGRATVNGDMLKLSIDEDPNATSAEPNFATIYIDRDQAALLANLLMNFAEGK
jgi:hypothetical protein